MLFGAAANIVSFTFILVSVRLSTSQTICWKPGDTWVILGVSTALSFTSIHRSVISEPLLSDPGEKACKTPVAKPSGGSFPCHDLSHSPTKKGRSITSAYLQPLNYELNLLCQTISGN